MDKCYRGIVIVDEDFKESGEHHSSLNYLLRVQDTHPSGSIFIIPVLISGQLPMSIENLHPYTPKNVGLILESGKV